MTDSQLPRQVVVTIDVDDQGNILSIEPHRFQISKKAGQEVFWKATKPISFTVEFTNGTPFSRTRYDGHPYSSGQARHDVTLGQVFQYTVTTAAAGMDPEGVVNQ